MFVPGRHLPVYHLNRVQFLRVQRIPYAVPEVPLSVFYATIPIRGLWGVGEALAKLFTRDAQCHLTS